MLSAQDIAYLRQRAAERGYNPDHLLKVMNYESSMDPSRWGGKGGNYFGLIQFGPNERKQFGVDTVHPSAQNQIDATMRYLQTRGYRPGMGLLDLYSTVNAGSPGHYNASDGNGTVAQHVARMGGAPITGAAPHSMAAAFMPPPPPPPMDAPAPQQLSDVFKAPEPVQMQAAPQIQEQPTDYASAIDYIPMARAAAMQKVQQRAAQFNPMVEEDLASVFS